MRSKVHPKYKTKYRVGNWSAYEQALVQRGDVTLWLSADATDAWRPSPSGRPGAPKKFSDCAIETALTLRLVFRLPAAAGPAPRCVLSTWPIAANLLSSGSEMLCVLAASARGTEVIHATSGTTKVTSFSKHGTDPLVPAITTDGGIHLTGVSWMCGAAARWKALSAVCG